MIVIAQLRDVPEILLVFGDCSGILLDPFSGLAGADTC